MFSNLVLSRICNRKRECLTVYRGACQMCCIESCGFWQSYQRGKQLYKNAHCVCHIDIIKLVEIALCFRKVCKTD